MAIFLSICSHDQFVLIISASAHSPEDLTWNKCSLAPLCCTVDLHGFWSSRQQHAITCIKWSRMSELLWIDGATVGAPVEQTGDGMWCTYVSSPLWSDPCGMGLHRHGSLHRSSWFGSWSGGGANLSLLVTPLAPRFSAQLLTRLLLSHMLNWNPLEAIITHFEFCQMILLDMNMQNKNQKWELDRHKAERCFLSELPGAFKPLPGEREKLHEHQHSTQHGRLTVHKYGALFTN